VKTHIYKNTDGPAPIVYLNVFEGDGSDVWENLMELICHEKMLLKPQNDFGENSETEAGLVLVAISDLEWDEMLSPWEADSLFKENHFTGGGPEYLKMLREKIIPEVESKLSNEIQWRGLAGYSMAGLFAAWAGCQSLEFQRIASVSGSLWYPGIREWIVNNGTGDITKAYFSLGNKEHKVRNSVMATVKERTMDVYRIFQHANGVEAFFEENPGNHFTEPTQRMAKGIRWILE